MIDLYVSVIAPLHDDGALVEGFVEETLAVLEASYTNYELVLVDDGSRDDTAQRIRALLGRHPCIRFLQLSREFGLEIAIASGLDAVIGDFVAILRPDSDPPGLIPAMVERARAGRGLVYGVRTHRRGDPVWLRLGAAAFYALGERLFHWNLPHDTTHFRVLSRQAVNALSRFKDKYRSLRLMTMQLGYGVEPFAYEPVARGRKRRHPGLFESLATAYDLAVTYSLHPLRWVSRLALGAATVNLAYLGYVLAIFLFRSHVAEGWTTLSLQSSGMFFLLFLVLTVLCEYVGRILEETRERPLYHVMEEHSSNVLIAHSERRNVTAGPDAPHTPLAEASNARGR